MAFQWQDNLHSTTFSPRDYQVELLAAASEENVIVCLGHNSSKEFIALKLILEKSHELRRKNNRKHSLIITQSATGGESLYNLVFHLTDLKVINLNSLRSSDVNFEGVFNENQVVILSIDLCLDALICSYLDLETINLIVLEECHRNETTVQVSQLFDYFKHCGIKPNILGLGGAIHNAGCQTNHLSFHLEQLEKSILCRAETASDIVTVLRYFIVIFKFHNFMQINNFHFYFVDTAQNLLNLFWKVFQTIFANFPVLFVI